jgi:transposase
MDVHWIKIENHEEICAVKFLFLQGKRSKVIHAELSEVRGEAAVSLATVKRWCWRFKDGNLSLDDDLGLDDGVRTLGRPYLSLST